MHVASIEPYQVGELADPLRPFSALEETVDVQRLADNVSDRVARSERCVRILEDHRHLPAKAPERLPMRACDGLAAIRDHAFVRIEAADQSPAQRRLPTTRLSTPAKRHAL